MREEVVKITKDRLLLKTELFDYIIDKSSVLVKKCNTTNTISYNKESYKQNKTIDYLVNLYLI